MPVVDASVAVAWVVDQTASTSARTLLRAVPNTYVAPAIVLIEAHYAVAKLIQRGRAAASQLDDAIPLIARVADIVPLDRDLASTAGRFSLGAARLGLPHSFNIYDCAYIALAARRADTLITADRGQAAYAERFGVPVQCL
ncbi:MAG: type II toxin-antitoxin system VapC family toxin [Alphaproteobacteria bacterium]|nr:type II toxin-antitoxin system VapC family toxin [Alphaproteobacteria bacterium]